MHKITKNDKILYEIHCTPCTQPCTYVNNKSIYCCYSTINTSLIYTDTSIAVPLGQGIKYRRFSAQALD